MPRMPKYLKEEWAFFLDERGRKKYNELCRKCERSCKQSFRATVIQWRATVSCTPSKSKSINPPTQITGAFKLLDKASVPRGTGAILCLRETLSAIDSSTYIVPVWMI